MKAETERRDTAPSILYRDPRWERLVNATPPPLCLRERIPVLIAEEAGWAPGPVYTVMEMRKSLVYQGSNLGPSDL
jgi:hypothetical protein